MAKFHKKPETAKAHELTNDEKLAALSKKITRAAQTAGIGATAAQKYMRGEHKRLTGSQQADLKAAFGGHDKYMEIQTQFAALHCGHG